MGTVANILQGDLTAYWIAAGANDPVTAAGGGSVSWAGWTEFPFKTEDGMTFNYEAEYLPAVTSGNNAPVKRVLVGEDLTIDLPVLESDIATLQVLLPGATYTAAVGGTSPGKIELGDKASTTEYSLGFEGIAATGEELVIYVPRVVAVGSRALNFKKKDWRMVAGQFAAMPDNTNESAGSTLATIYEIDTTI